MLKKIKTIGSKMNDFSILDEIEKYLLEIFDDKINALENKQRFYEKVLKKSDQLEGEEKIFFQIKMFLKKMFDFKNIIDNELYITSPINNLNYGIILYGKNRCKKIITQRVV